MSTRVVVLGITDKSFGQPYILLSVRVSDDAGYFGEKLQAAHRQLLALWRRRAGQLQPNFKHTDILGALLAANQLFDEAPRASRKVLIVFSDMRNNSQDLDLESFRTVPSFSVLEKKSRFPVAELRGVEVYAYGVDDAGKSIAYWQTLKVFWTEYFRRAGAMLRAYSVLRQPSMLITQK